MVPVFVAIFISSCRIEYAIDRKRHTRQKLFTERKIYMHNSNNNGKKRNAEYQEMKKFNQFVFPSLYNQYSMNWSTHLFLFTIEIFEIIWIFSWKFMWFYFVLYLFLLCVSLVCVFLCLSRLVLSYFHSHIEIGYKIIGDLSSFRLIFNRRLL